MLTKIVSITNWSNQAKLLGYYRTAKLQLEREWREEERMWLNISRSHVCVCAQYLGMVDLKCKCNLIGKWLKSRSDKKCMLKIHYLRFWLHTFGLMLWQAFRSRCVPDVRPIPFCDFNLFTATYAVYYFLLNSIALYSIQPLSLSPSITLNLNGRI